MKAIISKELKRIFQDKKLVFGLFILPALIVIGISSLTAFLTASMQEDIENHRSKVYIQNAPEGLAAYISASGFADSAEIFYIDGVQDTEELKEEIFQGNIELLAVFDAQFLGMAAAYQKEGDPVPAAELFYNTRGSYSAAAKENFETMVLLPVREALLRERFGSLEVLNVFETKQTVLVDEAKKSGEVLAVLLPYFITFLLFMGAMSLGVDIFTGEKERGTMAGMLLAPVKRRDIVLGKLIALCILSCISAAVYCLMLILAVPILGGTVDGAAGAAVSGVSAVEMAAVSNIRFTAGQVFMLAGIMLVLVFLYVALVSLAAIIAKSPKEAHTYVSPIYMAVIAIGLITMFQEGTRKAEYFYAIPIYGNALAIQSLMTNELTKPQFLLSVFSAVLISAIVTGLLIKAFHSEKFMFQA